MKIYICDLCGYEYNEALGEPDRGIAANTMFKDLPEGWTCPLCGAGKEAFSEVQED